MTQPIDAQEARHDETVVPSEPLLEATAPDSEPLLRVRGLTVSIGDTKLLHRIDLDLAAGECLAIVGASGAGKSLLARSILGLSPAAASVQADDRTIGGWQTAGIGTHAALWRGIRGAIIGLVNQDALVSLDPLRRLGREVAEAYEIHTTRATRAQVAQRVRKALVAAAMPQPDLRARQYPHELSGGLRQRGLIASALSAEPRAIIADEPTTALDATVQAAVLDELHELRKGGLGLIVITHDLGVVSRLADRILVLDNGRAVETGRASTVLRNPEHAATIALLDAAPRDRAAAVADADAPIVLEARDLTKQYGSPRRHRPALSRVSLELREGTTLGIVGESGSGKSTLARLLLGLEEPTSGEVLLEGEAWSGVPERERRPRRGVLQLVDQDPFGTLSPRWRIRRVLGEAIRLTDADATGEARHERMLQLLELVDLPPSVLARRPHELSGGQRQRVAIARALARRPRILVCDEPVSALDATVQARVLDLLDDLRTKLGLSMVFISHDLDVVTHIADDVLVMKDGEVVESGRSSRVLARPKHPFTKELKSARLRRPMLPS